MICCGERHVTPYCPHCGTKLNPDGSREGLILYLIQQRDLIKDSGPRGRGKDDPDRIKEHNKTKNAQLRLFRDWLDQLLPHPPETTPATTTAKPRKNKQDSPSPKTATPKKKTETKKKATTKKVVKKKAAKKKAASKKVASEVIDAEYDESDADYEVVKDIEE